MATQEALDDYIEGLPNRSEGYFSGFDEMVVFHPTQQAEQRQTYVV